MIGYLAVVVPLEKMASVAAVASEAACKQHAKNKIKRQKKNGSPSKKH